MPILSKNAQRAVEHYWGSLESAAKFMRTKRVRQRHICYTNIREVELFTLSGWQWGILWPTEFRWSADEPDYPDALKVSHLPGYAMVSAAEIIAALLAERLISWEDCEFSGRGVPVLKNRRTINKALKRVNWGGPFLSEEPLNRVSPDKKQERKKQKLEAELIRLQKRIKEVKALLA